MQVFTADPAAMPPSPRVTSLTISGSGSDKRTVSVREATSAGDAQASAPCAASAPIACSFVSKTKSR